MTYRESVSIDGNLLDHIPTLDGHLVVCQQVLHYHISQTLAIRIPAWITSLLTHLIGRSARDNTHCTVEEVSHPVVKYSLLSLLGTYNETAVPLDTLGQPAVVVIKRWPANTHAIVTLGPIYLAVIIIEGDLAYRVTALKYSPL